MKATLIVVYLIGALAAFAVGYQKGKKRDMPGYPPEFSGIYLGALFGTAFTVAAYLVAKYLIY